MCSTVLQPCSGLLKRTAYINRTNIYASSVWHAFCLCHLYMCISVHRYTHRHTRMRAHVYVHYRSKGFSLRLLAVLFSTHSDLCVSAVHSCGGCVCERKTIFKNLVLPVFAGAETLTFQQRFRCVGVMLA